MSKEYTFGAKIVKNILKVVNTDLADTEKESIEVNLGNHDGFGILLPANLSNLTLKLWAYCGEDTSGADAWIDVTNTLFSSQTLATKGVYNVTNKFLKIKLEVTATNNTNSGKVDLVVFAK